MLMVFSNGIEFPRPSFVVNKPSLYGFSTDLVSIFLIIYPISIYSFILFCKTNFVYLNLSIQVESPEARTSFINSAVVILKNYGFDGLDLAWEWPKNKPKKIRGALGKIGNNVDRVFT